MASGDEYYHELPQEDDRQQLDMEEEERLKYLGFIQVAAIHAVMSFMNFYLYAKDKAGPLKPGVENVEGAVKTVVGPVYDKFHGVPTELLKFVDRKMDESVANLPPVVKQVSAKALSAAQSAPGTARAMASEVQQAGVKETATELAKTVYVKCEPKAKEIYSKYEPVAKDLYSKYEPKAEQCAVSAWRKLNQLPVFPRVARVVVPTAAYCAEKYNETVLSTAKMGYKVSTYMPLVPTQKIARVFSEEAGAAPVVTN